MISNRGRIGAGESRLPCAIHRVPSQKKHKHIPRITHSSDTKSNLRLDIPQHASDLGLGERSILDSPTPLTSPPATHHSKPNYRPRFLSLVPNDHSLATGCKCAHRAGHTHQSYTHTPKDSLSTPYKSLVIGKPIAHSHWHRLDLTLHPTRQKFKRHTYKRVRFPTVRQLRTKVQMPTTILHTKPIQCTYSFTPLN
jgi:hypothetical protein